MKPLRIAILATTFCALACGARLEARLIRDHRNPSVQGGLWEPTAGFVTDVTVHLSKGKTVVFATANLSANGDPVLHLLGPGASANGVVEQLAMDDDGGGNLNARLRFTPPKDGDYRLILRAASSESSGTCTLLRDGATMFSSVRFGAAIREYDNLRVGETLTTVFLPNGVSSFPALYLLNARGEIIRRHISFDVFVKATIERAYGTVYLLAASWVPLGSAGPLRVVRNDAALSGHDPDGDGLGSELEKSIGTCSSRTDIAGNWECSRAADLRDTDGDGISDADEVLGRLTGNAYQLLPLWGADPRHKDIFIEVDYGKKSLADPDQKMPPAVAREMAAAYAEQNVTLTPLDALLHAQLLNNPDLQPGVRLHLDTGVPPEKPADATIYGDWGGHTAVPPICDRNGCRQMPVLEAYGAFMKAERKGLFHYTASYAGSGGQCGAGVACSWSHTDSRTSIHEFGHTLTLEHYGPHTDGVPEANCKVSYPSVMSYAQAQPYTFSDGTGRPSYNNVALSEIGAVPQPGLPRHQALLARLRDLYGYQVDLAAGNVDWNRDGIFQPGTVAAYANTYPDGDCELSSANRIPLGASTLEAPALARLGSQVFLFFLDAGNHLAVLASNPFPFHCPPGGFPGCGSTAFASFAIDQPWNQGLGSVDVQRIVDREIPKLLILFRDASGRLFETKMEIGSGGPRFGDATAVPTTHPVAEEISVTGKEDHVWLIYKDANGALWLKKRLSITSAWSADAAVLASHLPVPGPRVPALASPALHELPDGTLYGAFPLADRLGQGDTLRLWTYHPGTGLWSDTNLLQQAVTTLGRPAMAWRPLPPGAALPGRLYVYWTPRNADGTPSALREAWTVRGSDGHVDMSFAMKHSNEWFSAHGVAALFEPGTDDNIRLAVAFGYAVGATPDGALEIRPKADGIVDLVQVDRDDWAGMATGLCRILVGEQKSNPIRCP
jgi:hypothetical protein